MDLSEYEINTNSTEEFKDGAFEIVSVLRPAWGSKLNFSYTIFTDGLTNKLIGVYSKELPKDMILIRVYGQNSDLMIDRQKEIRNMKILHSNGCGAELYAIFKNGIAYEYQSEYGDWNYREFDIANHFNEFVGLPDEQTGILDYSKHYPSRDFQTRWLEIYLKYCETNGGVHQNLNKPEFRSKVEKLLDLVEKFSPLSNLLWGIWSLIQAKYSDIDFDYINYAMQRLNQYKRCRINS